MGLVSNMSTENNSGRLKREIAAGVTKAMAYHITITYAIPFGVTLLTGIIGYITGIPWFWIWLGLLAAFSFISNGLLRFDEWLYRRKIQDKLTFGTVLVGRSITNDGYTIGVSLNNSATFPIEFEITDIRTKLGTTVPEKNHTPKTIVIPPKGYGWYNDEVIKLPSTITSSIEGLLEYSIKYGKPGALNYTMTGKKQIVVSFNSEGFFVGAVWHNAT